MHDVLGLDAGDPSRQAFLRIVKVPGAQRYPLQGGNLVQFRTTGTEFEMRTIGDLLDDPDYLSRQISGGGFGPQQIEEVALPLRPRGEVDIITSDLAVEIKSGNVDNLYSALDEDTIRQLDRLKVFAESNGKTPVVALNVAPDALSETAKKNLADRGISICYLGTPSTP